MPSPSELVVDIEVTKALGEFIWKTGKKCD
jgi:hypothetical protein